MAWPSTVAHVSGDTTGFGGGAAGFDWHAEAASRRTAASAGNARRLGKDSSGVRFIEPQITPSAGSVSVQYRQQRFVPVKTRIVVNDRMQRNYVYVRTEPIGRHFAPEFQPQLTPREMLALGVFGGRYMTDCRAEFPASWFTRAKLCSTHHDAQLNYFGVNASQSLATWW